VSGLVELGFIVACVLVPAIWELIRVRRELRRDADARSAASPEAGDGQSRVVRPGAKPSDVRSLDSSRDGHG
jgi:hypothetical protein